MNESSNMTPDDQARALIEAHGLSYGDVMMLTKGNGTTEICERIVKLLQSSRPTWTDARPTVPGEYWWRKAPGGDAYIVTVFVSKVSPYNLAVCSYRSFVGSTPLVKWAGQWARITLPEDQP